MFASYNSNNGANNNGNGNNTSNGNQPLQGGIDQAYRTSVNTHGFMTGLQLYQQQQNQMNALAQTFTAVSISGASNPANSGSGY